jgi:hypothetical protein
MRQEMNIIPIIANTDIYRKHWVGHLLRMDGSQILKIIFEYNPKGRSKRSAL